MESLSQVCNLPWLCIGDSNDITRATEKERGNMRPLRQMNRFRHVINHSGFYDLGFYCSPFTWFKNQSTKGWLKIRLDRALATNSWRQKYQDASVHHISSTAFDHSILSLRLTKAAQGHQRKKKKLFRFEAMWLTDPRCDEVVIDSWNEGLYKSGGSQFTNCMVNCKEKLSVWNKEKFSHVGRKIA